MVSNIRRAAIAGIGSAVVLAWASSSFAEDTGRPEAEAPGITATRTFGASGAVVAAQGSSEAPAEKQNSDIASPSNLFVAGVITLQVPMRFLEGKQEARMASLVDPAGNPLEADQKIFLGTDPFSLRQRLGHLG